MLNNYFTVEEVADLLDIDAISATELLDGTIEFESSELYALALYKGITIKELSSMLQKK